MDEALEAVFGLWEAWDMETDGDAKDALRLKLFIAIDALVAQLHLKGPSGLTMTSREFLQSSRGHYRNWRRRAH